MDFSPSRMALASFLRLEEHLFRKISTMCFNLEYDDCIWYVPRSLVKLWDVDN